MTDITIKKNLNIVFSAGGFIVHSVPVRYEVYRSVAEVLAATTARMISMGNMFASTQAQAVFPAYMETAKRAKMLSGEEYNLEYDGFLGELKSMTTLIKDGQTTVLDVALQTGLIDEEMQDFIFGQLIFFMLTSKREKSKTIEQVADSIGASTTSLTAMAYASSLMTATASDVTG